MTLKTTNEIWSFPKKEYEGNERVKGMQVLNLIREFEMQRMNESETIKDYSDRFLDIVNKGFLVLISLILELFKKFLSQFLKNLKLQYHQYKIQRMYQASLW